MGCGCSKKTRQEREASQYKEPASEDMYQKRIGICRECEHVVNPTAALMRCDKCGCFLHLKARIRSMHCPEKKW